MPLDLESLFALSYGLYVVSSVRDEKLNGQISNTVMQVTDSPPQIAVAVNKTALTHEYIASSGLFAVTVLAEDAPMKLIGLFGFRSGRDTDKFSEVRFETGVTGCPIVREHALAWVETRVKRRLDCGTHTLFVGEIVGSHRIARGRPMTYAYYREVLRGRTPPTAPTYRAGVAHEGVPALHEVAVVSRSAEEAKGAPGMKKYVCEVCGYVYDPEKGDPESGVRPGIPFSDLPDDWVCPVCGAAKDQFEPEG